MKALRTVLTVLLAASLAAQAVSCNSSGNTSGGMQPTGNNYMWFDCEANYRTLSTPDSIKFYLEKVKGLGFTNVVVDVKSIMGEVLYDSSIAPYMSPFDSVERPRDYDMMGLFIKYGHELGMKVYASLNIFCGGHNFMDRGIIYTDHPQWQSICYEKGRLVPISHIKTNYNGMLNPSDPQVQEYELDILKEFVSKYMDCDGLIFDRLRYDGITADFSDLSLGQFARWASLDKVPEPEDILSWYAPDGKLREQWAEGRYFRQWCLWRATVIHDFVERTHRELKAINPDLTIGDYTGAWYPTYYEVGVNWAADSYDPSADFDWAGPEYARTGYAQLLDIYMTGLYYSYITKQEIDGALASAPSGNSDKSGEAALRLELKYCYSVEGGAELAKTITKGVVPVIGSIYVEQYIGQMQKFPEAVRQSLLSTGGVMVFDIVHLGKHGLWGDLEKVMRECGQI